MRRLLAALILSATPVLAHADPVQEARSATGACLSAVIDGAPVEDVDGDDVTIRRGADPVSCTVRVTAGEPVVVRDAVLTAVNRRSQIFAPARSKWTPGEFASRETFCNLPGRRALVVVVDTAKPGRAPVLTATVFEMGKRDARCDQDLGLQDAALAGTAAARAPDAPIELAPPAKAEPKPKRRWLPSVPKLSLPNWGRKES